MTNYPQRWSTAGPERRNSNDETIRHPDRSTDRPTDRMTHGTTNRTTQRSSNATARVDSARSSKWHAHVRLTHLCASVLPSMTLSASFPSAVRYRKSTASLPAKPRPSFASSGAARI